MARKKVKRKKKKLVIEKATLSVADLFSKRKEFASYMEPLGLAIRVTKRFWRVIDTNDYDRHVLEIYPGTHSFKILLPVPRLGTAKSQYASSVTFIYACNVAVQNYVDKKAAGLIPPRKRKTKQQLEDEAAVLAEELRKAAIKAKREKDAADRQAVKDAKKAKRDEENQKRAAARAAAKEAKLLLTSKD